MDDVDCVPLYAALSNKIGEKAWEENNIRKRHRDYVMSIMKEYGYHSPLKNTLSYEYLDDLNKAHKEATLKIAKEEGIELDV